MNVGNSGWRTRSGIEQLDNLITFQRQDGVVMRLFIAF